MCACSLLFTSDRAVTGPRKTLGKMLLLWLFKPGNRSSVARCGGARSYFLFLPQARDRLSSAFDHVGLVPHPSRHLPDICYSHHPLSLPP